MSLGAHQSHQTTLVCSGVVSLDSQAQTQIVSDDALVARVALDHKSVDLQWQSGAQARETVLRIPGKIVTWCGSQHS